jgi:hypothetical protein
LVGIAFRLLSLQAKYSISTEKLLYFEKGSWVFIGVFVAAVVDYLRSISVYLSMM